MFPSRTERRGFAIIVGLFLLTAFMGAHFIPAWPQVWTGDEPHYFVMLTSLVEDGDLALGNNYADVHRGGAGAGRRFMGFPLDHQTTWWEGSERVAWSETFVLDRARWARDGAGHPEPVFVPGQERDMTGVVERPVHPPGLPWLLALFTWPLAGTALLEPAVLLIITLMVLAAAAVFHVMIRPWASDPILPLLVTAAAFFGTPLWCYSRLLYVEGPLTLCAVGAYAFVLAPGVGRKGATGAGLLLALGALMKPPFLLLVVPLGALLLVRRQWDLLVCLALTSATGLLVTLAANRVLNGEMGRAPQPFVMGDPLEGLWGLLFSQWKGLFWFAPVSIAAVIGWPAFRRAHEGEARVLLGAIGLYFGLMATWSVWGGGDCYGPRLILPVVPFLMVGLLGLATAGEGPRRLTVGLAAVSFIISFLAAGPMAHVRAQNLLVSGFASLTEFASRWTDLRLAPARVFRVPGGAVHGRDGS